MRSGAPGGPAGIVACSRLQPVQRALADGTAATRRTLLPVSLRRVDWLLHSPAPMLTVPTASRPAPRLAHLCRRKGAMLQHLDSCLLLSSLEVRFGMLGGVCRAAV